MTAPARGPPALATKLWKVDVRDLGYRWGSARPTNGPQRINVHWATAQLPPSLIDYILIHELAHLRETNHTSTFWSIVARLMPTYEQHRATLATIGKIIWLGSDLVAPPQIATNSQMADTCED